MGKEVSYSWPSPPRLSAADKRFNPYNRRWQHHPDPNSHELISPFREFLHSWKHSRNALFYFSYRVCQGALMGAVLGGLLITPLTRHSSYVNRKLQMFVSRNEFVPLDMTKAMVRSYSPYFAGLGGALAFSLTYTSEWFDHAIDCNRLTKYILVGVFNGILFGGLFGRFGWWFYGGLLGLAIGITSAGLNSRVLEYHRGESGRFAAEYMPDVTAEQKRRYRLEEARIMGLPGLVK